MVAWTDMLMVRRNPARSRRKSTQGAVAILRQKKGPRLCISKFRSKEVYSSEIWANEIERFGGTHHKILGTNVVRNSNSERKGPPQGVVRKGQLHERNPCAPKFWGKNTWGNLKTRRVCPQSSMGFGEKIWKLKAEDKATFHSPVEIKALVLVSKNTEERMFAGELPCTCWARRIQAQMKWILYRDRKCRSADKRGSTSVRWRSRSARHSAITAVLSLGMLCSEHGCLYEWKNGETPRLTKNGKTKTWKMDNFVPLVVPGLSSSSSSSSASTLRPKDQSSDPMQTRSAKHARGKPMQTNPDKQASGNRGSAQKEDEMND